MAGAGAGPTTVGKPGWPAAGAALDWAAAWLAARGVPEARVDARVLLRWATGQPVEALLAHPERPLSRLERLRFRWGVARRGCREPVQYIAGGAEFYSRWYDVPRGVLIPRPETELLVEQALAALAGRSGPLAVADLGTGSGALAVTLALELSRVRVHAVDVSGAALAAAWANAGKHGVGERILLYQGDLWAPLEAAGLAGCLDAVVSNPPYVSRADWVGLAPEVRRYEPRTALVAGEDGLAFHRRIAAGAPRFLRPGGWLLVEVGAGQGAAVAALLRMAGLVEVTVTPDIAGHDRIVAGRLA